ncbi:MAG: glucose-1-phosphate cytidylyltransferase [Deltaproteobacteria bacterium]|nr:glucose-1-phosphate cytidylyltransferase [Deltaproteobacteria bacterium]
MKVAILCGGQGTRLQEATAGLKPKPMVEIGGRPILWHIMKYYSCFGHSDFVLCLGHLAYVIKEYFLNYEANNSDFTIQLDDRHGIQFHRKHDESDWSITLADTGPSSMTGSRVAQIQKYIGNETFMLTYGDGLSDVNIDDLLKFHKSHGKTATVTGVTPSGRFGRLNLSGNKVNSFEEKPADEGGGKINGGFFVFEPGIFDYVQTDPSCVLERTPMEQLARDGELMMYAHNGFWECVDTYRDLVSLQKKWNNGSSPWKRW